MRRLIVLLLAVIVLIVLYPAASLAQPPPVYSSPGSYTYTVPNDVYQIKIEAWGAGGGAGDGDTELIVCEIPGGGGGGGLYAMRTIDVIPSQQLWLQVGRGGMGGNSGKDGIEGENSKITDLTGMNVLLEAGGGGGGEAGECFDYSTGDGGYGGFFHQSGQVVYNGDIGYPSDLGGQGGDSHFGVADGGDGREGDPGSNGADGQIFITVLLTATTTPTASDIPPTSTDIPPTSTFTETPSQPTETATEIIQVPTNTDLPTEIPTLTPTFTETDSPATSTDTLATETEIPPTETALVNTNTPQTASATAMPPTVTATGTEAIPDTPTATSTATLAITVTQTTIPITDTFPTFTFTPTLFLTVSPTLSPTLAAPSITPTPVMTENREELLSNGDMEIDVDGEPLPDGWTLKAGEKDKRKCQDGNCFFQFKGSLNEKAKLSQDTNTSGIVVQTGDKLALTLQVDANKATVRGKVIVRVAYSDQPLQKVKLDLVQTTGFEPLNQEVVLTSGNVVTVRVQIKHSSTAGKVRIDEVSLMWVETAGLLPLP